MKKLIILLIVIIVGFLGFFIWWQNGIDPVNKTDTSEKIFVVSRGAGLREIANNLKRQGLIKDAIVFFLLVKQKGIDKKIQAGDFRLSPSMHAMQIAENLTHGSLDVWVTIPEGKRAEEIADILKEKLPSYEESWREILIANEGYLFPDTYLISKEADIDTVVSLLKNTFDTRYGTITNGANRTQQEIVTIASLIEREAKTDEEKPIISGIIHNRLDLGMALQIDATIQYAKGFNSFKKTWWDGVAREEYKSVQSPYNTYLNPGLPPGPIANPGLEALRAAANPKDTPYLYYLHDGSGNIHYAITINEHNANNKKYNGQ